jgi:hypothetical protein
MSNNDTFLNKPEGMTVCFSPKGDGTVYVQWQQTLDPDEELNDETMSKEAARAYWKELRGEGYKPASGWHSCKRRQGDCGYFHDE